MPDMMVHIICFNMISASEGLSYTSNFKKVKMKYFKKTCVHDKAILAMNAEEEKYLNYEPSSTRDLIGNACVCGYDSKQFNFLGVPRKFKCYRGGYARVTLPETLVLNKNENINLFADDEVELLAAGNT